MRRGAAAEQPPVVLSVAGSDSGGGAGIQADLKTFAACGVFGATAVTALTAQNSGGVSGIEPVAPAFVASQMAAVLDDFAVAAVKTGMLPSVEVVEAVAEQLRHHPGVQLVVDPVMVSTSGHSLAAAEVGAAISRHLFPLATVVTPNLSEAAALLGWDPITSPETMQEAAAALHAQGPQFVLVKGGHLAGDGDIVDVLYDGSAAHRIPGPRIDTPNTHGTGCTTASAVAAFLARGLPPVAAVRAARQYVVAALQGSVALQLGGGPQRPFDHMAGSCHRGGAASLQPGSLAVYAVTDPGCNAARGRSNAEAVAAAVAGGVSCVQLREKDAEGGAFCREAAAVLAVTRAAGVPLLINDRVDVALAVGAEGVHVGQGDLPAAAVRRMLGPGRLLGVSVKTVREAQQAEADGADYLGAGAMFATATKDSSTIGFDTLAAICSSVSIPVVAIGGIKAENAAACMAAGCAGIAVVSAIFGAEDPAAAASAIRAQVRSPGGGGGSSSSS